MSEEKEGVELDGWRSVGRILEEMKVGERMIRIYCRKKYFQLGKNLGCFVDLNKMEVGQWVCVTGEI